MTAIGLAGRPSSAGWAGRRFYLIMAIVIGAVIVAGFSRTAPHILTTPPGLPLLLHIHGAVFLAWLGLFVAQPALAVRGSLKLHRQLGYFGAGLAALMVIMGIAATLFAIHTHIVPDFFPQGVFLAMNVIGVVFFGGLVAAGVILRRQAEWHKRLMLCATTLLLGPGLGRLLPMDSFGAAAPLVMFGVQDAILLAGPVVDLAMRRRIHPAYYWGVGVVVLSQLLTPPLGFSPPVLALANLIAR
jgi:hypothetical protein